MRTFQFTAPEDLESRHMFAGVVPVVGTSYPADPSEQHVVFGPAVAGRDTAVRHEKIDTQDKFVTRASREPRAPLRADACGCSMLRKRSAEIGVQSIAGAFFITNHTISAKSDSGELALLTFEPGFLTGLKATDKEATDEGHPSDKRHQTVYTNGNVRLTFSPDSVMTIEFSADARVSVTGDAFDAFHFELGNLIAQNENGGVYVAQDWANKWDKLSTLRVRNPKTSAWEYSDQNLAAAGLKFWNAKGNFSADDWVVHYNFRSGDTALVGLTTPQNPNRDTYAKTYVNTLPVNTQDDDDFTVRLENFKNRVADYGFERYVGMVNWSNNYVYASAQDAVSGPYKLVNEVNMRALVDRAHAVGVEIILYTSMYYSPHLSVDAMLANYRYLSKKIGVDGFYIDGPFRGDVLKSRELVSRLRDLLGEEGIIVVHSSEGTFGSAVEIHAPYDNFADIAWSYEGLEQMTPNELRLNFASATGTVYDVLPEVRRYDDAGKLISQVDQFRLVLAAGGRMRINSPLDRQTGKRIAFPIDDYHRLWSEHLSHVRCCGRQIRVQFRDLRRAHP